MRPTTQIEAYLNDYRIRDRIVTLCNLVHAVRELDKAGKTIVNVPSITGGIDYVGLSTVRAENWRLRDSEMEEAKDLWPFNMGLSVDHHDTDDNILEKLKVKYSEEKNFTAVLFLETLYKNRFLTRRVMDIKNKLNQAKLVEEVQLNPFVIGVEFPKPDFDIKEAEREVIIANQNIKTNNHYLEKCVRENQPFPQVDEENNAEMRRCISRNRNLIISRNLHRWNK